jgi:hypothetical protein
MGGLASRWYLENDDTVPVDKLITIGTPNLGSYFLDLSNDVILAWSSLGYAASLALDLNSPAVQDMKSDSQALSDLNSNIYKLPRSTNYISIIGQESTGQATSNTTLWLSTILPGLCLSNPAECVDLTSRSQNIISFLYDSDELVSTESQNLNNVNPAINFASATVVGPINGVIHFYPLDVNNPITETNQVLTFLQLLGLP